VLAESAVSPETCTVSVYRAKFWRMCVLRHFPGQMEQEILVGEQARYSSVSGILASNLSYISPAYGSKNGEQPGK
jgi:hypothetical protein